MSDPRDTASQTEPQASTPCKPRMTLFRSLREHVARILRDLADAIEPPFLEDGQGECRERLFEDYCNENSEDLYRRIGLHSRRKDATANLWKDIPPVEMERALNPVRLIQPPLWFPEGRQTAREACSCDLCSEIEAQSLRDARDTAHKTLPTTFPYRSETEPEQSHKSTADGPTGDAS